MSDTSPPERPRIRVAAGSEPVQHRALDGIANFVARLGLGTGNILSGSTYQFAPISRLQQLMEWAYRGSWLIGAAVDCVADDMTRAGVQFNTDLEPDKIGQLTQAMHALCVWQSLNEAIKWGRLYGGALAVMLIDGQDLATPLNADSIRKDQFKGFLVLDRWMIQQNYTEVVREIGPDLGLPEYYMVIQTAPAIPRARIHYSRCIRVEGVTLPFRQRIAENGWGMSVIERLYDRLIAFDSGTMGAAQLLFKAYLRVYKVKDYKQLVSLTGQHSEGFHKSLELMRLLQSTEGLTVIDAEDDFATFAYSFAGVSDTLLALGQQISGALGIPLVRLFGQSPAGLSATGESDLRNYYDMVNAAQEARLRRPLTTLFEVLCRSELGTAPPEGFGFKFASLWQLTEGEKSEIAQRDADSIKLLHDGAVITPAIALKELKQSSTITGRFSNITDEDIAEAEAMPPQPMMPGGQGQGAPGGEGAQPPSLSGGGENGDEDDDGMGGNSGTHTHFHIGGRGNGSAAG